MSLSLSGIIIIISSIIIYITNSQSCNVSFPSYGVSFDLSPLTILNTSNISWYYLSDNKGFDFYLNICQNIIGFPINDCKSATSSHNANTPSMAFQIDVTNTTGSPICYHLTKDSPSKPEFTIDLIDTDDPSFGISFAYEYGDYDSQCQSDRDVTIQFICDTDYSRNNYNEMLQDAVIETQSDCITLITLPSIYACPLECSYGSDEKLCSNHGTCGHDEIDNTAKCFCYAGYSGNDCSIYLGTNEQEKDYNYDAGIDFSSPFIHTLYSDRYGYNVTYDLSFLEYGMGEKGYFVLKDKYNINAPCYFYFNLVNHTALDILQPIGVGAACNTTNINDQRSLPFEWNHTLGYSYAQCPNHMEHPYTGLPDADCDSFGRHFEGISFYDEEEPYRGFQLRYTRGDDEQAFAAEYGSVFNFICVDDYTKETIDPIDGLNQYFIDKEYNFRYVNTAPDKWIFFPNTIFVDIYTVAACPAHCVTIDDSSSSLCLVFLFIFPIFDGYFIITITNKYIHVHTVEICHSNGICAFDPDINTVKCLCDGSDSSDPIYCDDKTSQPTMTTMSPSNNPSTEPTSKSPSMYPSLSPTQNPLLQPTNNPSESPLGNPSMAPLINPTKSPSVNPSLSSTKYPSLRPTNNPLSMFTNNPTENPTSILLINSTSTDDNGKSQKNNSGDKNNKNEIWIIVLIVILVVTCVMLIGALIYIKRKKLKGQLAQVSIVNNSEGKDEQKEGMLNDTFNNVSDMYKKITTSQI